MIPLFDSLAHPTISGQWFGQNVDAGFDHLTIELENNGFCGACAVGLDGVEGYEHERFITVCRAYSKLYPVAGIGALTLERAKTELPRLFDLGYRAIKIHPRFSQMTGRIRELQPVFDTAASMGFVVFYCTYMHTRLDEYPAEDPFYALVRLLKRSPSTKVVLVHGGDVSLLRYAELVRFNGNLLLDLSLTMMKYRGSSIDADIRFLVERFDRRICVGSDHPEYKHADIRERFEWFTEKLHQSKRENIGYRNLCSFLGIGY